MGEAALIAASCVLFVSMGLSDAVQGVLRVKLRILSCPKCLTFWTTLVWSLSHGAGFVRSVAASFLFSYVALWATLALDGLSVLYNKCYEIISKTTDTPKDTAKTVTAEAGSDEVS